MEYLPISLLILAFHDSNQRKLNGRYRIGAELFWWVGFRELGGVRKAPGGRKARQQRTSLSVTQHSDP